MSLMPFRVFTARAVGLRFAAVFKPVRAVDGFVATFLLALDEEPFFAIGIATFVAVFFLLVPFFAALRVVARFVAGFLAATVAFLRDKDVLVAFLRAAGFPLLRVREVFLAMGAGKVSCGCVGTNVIGQRRFGLLEVLVVGAFFFAAVFGAIGAEGMAGRMPPMAVTVRCRPNAASVNTRKPSSGR